MSNSYPPELVESLRLGIQAALEKPETLALLAEKGVSVEEIQQVTITSPTFGETTINV